MQYYSLKPGYVLSNRNKGSFLDLINISFEPFVLILAAGGAVLSFVLFQAIQSNGRRKRYADDDISIADGK